MTDKLYSYASNRSSCPFQGVVLYMFIQKETIGGSSPPL